MMDEVGFCFPGQGSQRVGMGRDLATVHPWLVDTYYEPAGEILGLPLARLCWEGPSEALRDTSITQPAVFLTSLCTAAVLRDKGVTPGLVAGHSLGEYTALVTAGVLDWTDALRLVRLRGQLMAEVNRRVPGAMVAVLGLPLANVERMCAEATAVTSQVAEIANDNAPGQVVVSGQLAAVGHVMKAAREAGARHLVELDVGAPFHCSLMRAIEDQFAAALARVTFHDPACPVISSVTGKRLVSGEEVRRVLTRQLTGRVRWTAAVTQMEADGVRHFIEVGPGKVLGGLCRRIVPDAAAHVTYDMRQLTATLATLAELPASAARSTPR
jgi:[acyl-carrier-protein] S-malonyltransferase